MIEMVVSPTFAPSIQMASIGIPDTMFLMVLALIVFGPRRLPEIGRQIGKLMYEFRKVSNEFKFQMEEELRASEEAERQAKLKAAAVVTPEMLPAPVQFEAGADTVAVTQAQTAGSVLEDAANAEPAYTEPGEVRGEPRKFPPHIQPPATGETVAAGRPYRTWNETAGTEMRVTEGTGSEGLGTEGLGTTELGRGDDAAHQVVTESGNRAETATDGQVSVVDEGRIGTEVQTGLDLASSRGVERETNHV